MSISELISLIQAVTALAFIVGFVWMFRILRQHPGSELEINVKDLSGRVSIEDARWLIAERLERVSDDEREALRAFNNERRTPGASGFPASDVVSALATHGLVKPDVDPRTGTETYRLALWGYRLLKNFLGVGGVHQPWEWLSDEERARIRSMTA